MSSLNNITMLHTLPENFFRNINILLIINQLINHLIIMNKCFILGVYCSVHWCNTLMQAWLENTFWLYNEKQCKFSLPAH